jgi:hypothetical protein
LIPPILSAPITREVSGPTIAAEPLLVELDPGDWTIGVTGYTNFTPTGGTAADFAAAYGKEDVTIQSGSASEITVTIRPVKVGATAASEGIDEGPGLLYYNLSYPSFADAAVSGELSLKKAGTPYTGPGGSPNLPISLTAAAGTDATVTASGTIAIDPGYYDLFIDLTKTYGDARAPQQAGQYLAAHVYSGLQTKAEYTFTGNDFVTTKFLSGTITIIKPSTLDLSAVTITALTGTPTTTSGILIGAGDIVTGAPVLTGGSTGSPGITGSYKNGVGNIVESPWILSVPVDTDYVWFLAAAKDTGSGTAQKTFWVANVNEGLTSPIPANGKDDIELRLNVAGLTVSFSGLPQDETTALDARKGPSGTAVSLTVPGDQTANTLSWAADDPLIITVGTGASFASYEWYLDGIKLEAANDISTDGALTGYQLTTSARKLTKAGHIITCRVTTSGTDPVIPAGTAYSKNLVLKVEL